VAGRILTRALLLFGIALYHLRLAALVRWLGRGSPKVLLYHDCADAESDYTAELNSTTPPALFAAHLDYLARHYSVVDLEEVVAGRAPPRAVAITFDDGYRSVYTGAFPALVRRGMPAVVYLIADAVDNRALVWVNELNWLLRAGGDRATAIATPMLGLPTDAPAAVIVDHCRVAYDHGTITNVIARLREALATDPQHAARAALYLSRAEIVEMAEARIRFGNHTATHPNLERLGEEEQAVEIGDAQRRLADVVPLVPSLAYPFGHHGPATARIAARFGLTSVAEVGGLNRRDRPERVGRVHLSGESIASLFARMEVVEPFKGALRDRRQRRATA
jgi:peptidoglycan/xylan/chitin deacetylase (PgdA/CDA1 family)